MTGTVSTKAIKRQRTRPSASENSLIAVTLAVTLAFSLVCGTVLWQERRNDRDHAAATMGNLVEAISSDISRTIEQYDLSLQGVRQGLQIPEIDTVSNRMRRAVLFDNSANYKYLGAMRVLDRWGKTVIDSRGSEAGSEDFSSEDLFLVHVNVPDVGLYVSRPFKGMNGESVVGFSRRISDEDGAFNGVVVGTLRLNYLLDLFRKLSPSQGSTLTLFALDGTMLMRFPYRQDDIGRSTATAQVFKEFQKSSSGSFEHMPPSEGVYRLYAYGQVGDFPLLMNVSLPLAEVYADWTKDAVVAIGLMLLLCGAMASSMLLLRRELRQRMAAEEKLARLAITDGLTGLANRRHFDTVIAREWQRAQRESTPISLLMIDADLFKPFNDTHGHQTGDQLLKAIGACISDRARRATDLGARYGGDEFALLLPNVAAGAAHDIGERIRKSIRDLCLPSEATPATVSVGGATIVPSQDTDHRDLIDVADKALYAAKAKGRDCCELIGPLPEMRSPRLVA